MDTAHRLAADVQRHSVRFAGRARRAAQLVGVRRTGTLTDGTPPAVPLPRLEALSHDLLSAPLRSVRYQHTSGWKSSGAYRVVLESTTGSTREVFCKVNDHRPEEIVALADFPAAVGPPELAVLRAPSIPAVERHVPRLHSSFEDDEGRVIIVMEALGARWHPSTSWSQDLLRAAKAAATLQMLLREQLEDDAYADLIDYGDDFSVRLNDYAHRHLTELAATTRAPGASAALLRWEELTRLYLPAICEGFEPTVVHGDFNPANVFLHVGRRQVKVIDWEWAGVGDGYRDLAGLLKRSPRRVEQRALRGYHQVAGGRPDWRRYERCQLERGLLDAAFLAVQLLQADRPPRMNMARFIETSLRRTIEAADCLAGA